jgi:hypothetical protein
MRRAFFLRLLLALAGTVVVTPAWATVDRYAVLIGNNLGARDEARLRFAESDATKLHQALKELGGFPPENTILLRGDDTATVRSAIITTNDRIRSSVAAGRQTVLLVYYSGHADSEALHIGDENFPLREIESLARGSAATLRLLVVDACRSGSLTKAKGGDRTDAFPVRIEQRLAGEGAVFLSSSTLNEEAQESDAISGSFFTHYLVSGLLGAADHNGDGDVSLEEAYRFTYDNTVRASSRTLIGVQHPSFRFELSGHGSFVLTSPFRRSGRAEIQFPKGINFLVMREDEEQVVAEIGSNDQRRRLSLRAGRYFVRGRTPNYLLEGKVDVVANAVTSVDERSLTRVEYARLVRKGGRNGRVFSVEAGYQATSAETGSLCHGGFAGPTVIFPRINIGLRLGFCRSRDDRGEPTSSAFQTIVDQFEASVRPSVQWDLRWASVGMGVGAGLVVIHQQFVTRGEAQPRWTTAGLLGVSGRVVVPVNGRWFTLLDAGAETMLTRKDQSPEGPAALTAFVVGRGLLGAGAYF